MVASVDLSGCDASGVWRMDSMFADCSSLLSLDLSSWNVSEVADMEYMFQGCSALTSLGIAGWNVSEVEDMNGMFEDCSSLASLDISGWDVSGVEDMGAMLSGCTSLVSLDFSSWDTTGIYHMDGMFEGCISLREIKTGKNYAIEEDDVFPDATSECGKWWSVTEGAWLSKNQIVEVRSRIADTYLSYEPDAPDLSHDGWVDLAGGRKGYARGGSLVAGWMDLGSSKFYFQPSGAMSVGWNDVEQGGKTMHYYFNPKSGNLVRNTWFQINGITYYFRPSGNLATGWATISDNGVDKKYYLDEDGQLLTGWQDIEVNDDILHYYFRPSGAMATGWADVDDVYKRYFNSKGYMLTGWRKIGSGTYYFRASGAMQTGSATIDGKVYEFSNKGVLIGEPPSFGFDPSAVAGYLSSYRSADYGHSTITLHIMNNTNEVVSLSNKAHIYMLTRYYNNRPESKTGVTGYYTAKDVESNESDGEYTITLGAHETMDINYNGYASSYWEDDATKNSYIVLGVLDADGTDYAYVIDVGHSSCSLDYTDITTDSEAAIAVYGQDRLKGQIRSWYTSEGELSDDGNLAISTRERRSCPFCSGTGRCYHCKGTGQVVASAYGTTCTDCYGTGKCYCCHGRGYYY